MNYSCSSLVTQSAELNLENCMVNHQIGKLEQNFKDFLFKRLLIPNVGHNGIKQNSELAEKGFKTLRPRMPAF